ncbi:MULTISPECIES: lipoprotein YedD [unclassified Pantoea]|uniref:lipoprotein YedD n=1 Tax=unclassified Pantoea TaxID=2630326 RepID=UPI0015CFBD59|nr:MULTISPECIES: lipoprotein YedD [unclassified Pantoea]NYS28791.1 lipoprotein [Pantoea sp. WMus005]
MKKWMLIAAMALGGCAQINDYENAVQTPAPADLQGTWQTVGPQSSLINEKAMASVIINADGSTLDCRQWMRVIAKPGKLTRLSGDYVNVTRQLRVMPLVVDNGELRYDRMTLRKVARPTVECQQALEEVTKQPKAAVIQNIEPQLLRTPITENNAKS